MEHVDGAGCNCTEPGCYLLVPNVPCDWCVRAWCHQLRFWSCVDWLYACVDARVSSDESDIAREQKQLAATNSALKQANKANARLRKALSSVRRVARRQVDRLDARANRLARQVNEVRHMARRPGPRGPPGVVPSFHERCVTVSGAPLYMQVPFFSVLT